MPGDEIFALMGLLVLVFIVVMCALGIAGVL